MAISTVLLIMFVVTMCVMAVTIFAGKRSSLTRAQRRELADLRVFKREVNRLAIQHQEIEPSLAACILDEVHAHEMKELS